MTAKRTNLNANRVWLMRLREGDLLPIGGPWRKAKDDDELEIGMIATLAAEPVMEGDRYFTVDTDAQGLPEMDDVDGEYFEWLLEQAQLYLETIEDVEEAVYAVES